MLAFRQSRPYGGAVFLYSSYYMGLRCWWFCFILCYRVFGGVWLLLGLLLAGIGVVPLAFFGLIVKSFWTPGLGPWLLSVFVAIMLSVLPRFLGLWIIYRCEKRNESEKPETPDWSIDRLQ
jgi:hypothetical protein